ncbi:biopolymer transporter ExbD [Burkholderiaceae bacterium FT117]|uniref:ExbD/TolR family protein n=1 Tax=Zeimonas sediminis TaxID=2944268 RepID=UPI0023431BCC|nr:biopolymer transporter ExbD [Zeimonas sediminis]MCM5572202.1 biopolymer transporter ExbD [Zeimonas sediminis]
MAFGSLGSGSNGQPMAEINTTPLVDVMLVLLVIFIITAPLLTHAIRLDLPRAEAPPAAEKPETIALSIDAAGGLYWNNDPLDGIATLSARLADAATRTPPPELHLRADRDTRYQRIAEVMSAARSAGVTNIGFVTDPTGLPPSPAAAAR